MTEQKKSRTTPVGLPSFPPIQIQANHKKPEEGDVAHAEDCGQRGGLARAPRKCELVCSSGGSGKQAGTDAVAYNREVEREVEVVVA